METWDDKVEALRRASEFARFSAGPMMSARDYDRAMDRIAAIKLELAEMRVRVEALERRAKNG